MPHTIAIIEDESVLRDVLVKKFEHEGFTVHAAADGEQGLEIIRTHAPDAVLLDIVMPKMNGYEVLRALTEAGGAVPPIIIISNSGQPVEIDKAMGLGARDYIVKAQITPEEVVAKVRGMLDGVPTPSVPTQPAQQAEVVADANGARILLVEDDQFLRELMLTKLKREGFSVIVAVDGREGLDAILHQRPALVLLDVILPGIDGFNVLQQARAAADPTVAKTPIILLSNLGQDSDVQKGRQLGATDYLIKANLTIDEIIKKIRKYIPES